MIKKWFQKVDQAFHKFSKIDQSFGEYCKLKSDYGYAALKYTAIYSLVFIIELVKIPFPKSNAQEPNLDKTPEPEICPNEQAYQTEAYEPTNHIIVHNNGFRIAVQTPNKPLQKLRWQDLELVSLDVDDSDLTEMYIEVIIKTKDSTFSFPNGAEGSVQFINQLSKIRGFKPKAYKNAINSATAKTTLIYSRP